jgi:Spy/CpxP family protein refolding chaperone
LRKEFVVKKFVIILGVVGGLSVTSLAWAQPFGPPGGPPGPPQPGQVLPGFLQEAMKLTAEQKKQVEEIQKEVDARLAKILTPEQKKMMQEMPGPFGFPGGPGAPGGGGFGPFGPGGFGGGFGQANRTDDVKKQLRASDEEWKVIGPKMQKVLAARQALTADVRGGDAGFGGPPFGGAPGGPPPGGPMAQSAISQAQAELKNVLNDPKHTAAEVKEKVAAVRQARHKARGELEAAQKDLLLLLTAEQEAVLVSLGYLE